MKDQKTKGKAPAMMTILLDRIFGLMALFLIGGFFCALNWRTLATQPKLVPLALIIAAVCVSSLIFVGLVLGPSSALEKRITQFLAPHDAKFLGIFRSVWSALLLYKNRPWSVLQAIFLSVLMQSAFMFYFAYLTSRIEGSLNLEGFFTVYPIAILLTAIPLAPAGLGVGHVAFEELYKLVGMSTGANVFNLYVLVQLIFNLSGVVPYLLMRKNSSVVKES